MCVTQNGPLALKSHLHVLESSTLVFSPTTYKNEKVVSCLDRARICYKRKY